MTNLDKCKQIIDTETGRVLLYRDEVETVLTEGDTISRAEAIDAVNEWIRLYAINRTMSNITSLQDVLRQLPSAQPYTEEQFQKIQDLEQAQLEEAYKRGYEEGQGEIIHCCECKYWKPGYITDDDDFIPPSCAVGWVSGVWRATDYCSNAERKGNG